MQASTGAALWNGADARPSGMAFYGRLPDRKEPRFCDLRGRERVMVSLGDRECGQRGELGAVVNRTAFSPGALRARLAPLNARRSGRYRPARPGA